VRACVVNVTEISGLKNFFEKREMTDFLFFFCVCVCVCVIAATRISKYYLGVHSTMSIDWHAIAKKEWAAARVSEQASNQIDAINRYKTAAVAWTWALAAIPVTSSPDLNIELMLYLRNRSKTYLKTGQYALALDDIEWLMRLQGLWDGQNLTVTSETREIYFHKCLEVHAKVRNEANTSLERVGKDGGGGGAVPTSWLESTIYLTKPDAFDVLISRTLDDIEHFAVALERFGNDRAAALVYKLLCDADMRDDDASDKWERRLMQAGRRAVASEQKRDAETKTYGVTASNSFAVLEDVRQTWHDLNVVARQYASGVGNNEIVHTENQVVGHLDRKKLSLHRIVLSGSTSPSPPPPPLSAPNASVLELGSDNVKEAGSATRTSVDTPSTRDRAMVNGEAKTAVFSDRSEEKKDEEKTREAGDSPNNVEARWTAEYGRGLYAVCALSKGEVVWMETPDVAATVDVEACVACARNVSCEARTRHCCAHCGEATIYCSDECRGRDKPIHTVLCGLDMRQWRAHVAKHGTSISSRNPLVVMRMLAQRVLQQKIESTRARPSESDNSSTSVSDTTHPSVTTTTTITPTITTAVTGGNDTKDYLFPPLSMSNVGWMRGSLHVLCAAPYAVSMSREQAYELYNRNRRYFAGHAMMCPQVYNFANFFVCIELLTTFGFSFDTAALNERKDGSGIRNCEVASGSGLYRLASNVNHSCEPNLLWTHPPETAAMPRNTIVFAATRDIAAGEQLFISYVNANSSYEERQNALAAHHFKCRCHKCTLKL
jgi:predicted RNA-binding Zn-ribbon protein involved in translation (DUF1610 family)